MKFPMTVLHGRLVYYDYFNSGEFYFFKYVGASVLPEMHKVTGLWQPVCTVTEITVTRRLQLIRHRQRSAPFAVS